MSKFKETRYLYLLSLKGDALSVSYIWPLVVRPKTPLKTWEGGRAAGSVDKSAAGILRHVNEEEARARPGETIANQRFLNGRR